MKKNHISAIIDILLYLIVYFFLQAICTAVFTMIPSIDATTGIILGQTTSAVLTIVIFVLLHWITLGTHYIRTRPWKVFLLIVILTLSLIFPSTWFEEICNVEMPDEYTQLFEQIMSQPLGLLTIGLIVPIAEEVLFRGAILGRLLVWLPKTTRGRWIAISISALLFAIAHGNLAQGAHAFAIGLLLGWMYYRTRSILPGLIFHWVNNSAAVVLTQCCQDNIEAKLIDICGGNAILMYSILGVSILIAIPSLVLLIRKI